MRLARLCCHECQSRRRSSVARTWNSLCRVAATDRGRRRRRTPALAPVKTNVGASVSTPAVKLENISASAASTRIHGLIDVLSVRVVLHGLHGLYGVLGVIGISTALVFVRQLRPRFRGHQPRKLRSSRRRFSSMLAGNVWGRGSRCCECLLHIFAHSAIERCTRPRRPHPSAPYMSHPSRFFFDPLVTCFAAEIKL